jgi:hypothetical protein
VSTRLDAGRSHKQAGWLQTLQIAADRLWNIGKNDRGIGALFPAVENEGYQPIADDSREIDQKSADQPRVRFCEACRILSIIYLFLAFAYCFGLKELVI